MLRHHELVVCCNVFDEELYNTYFKGEAKLNILLFNRRNFAAWLLLHPFALLGKTKRQAWFAYIKSVIEKQSPSVVHFEFSGLACFYLPVIKQLQIPVVASFRNSSERINIQSYKNRKEDLLQLFQYVSAVHCVSDDVKNIIAPYCKDRSKIFINYPSVPVDYFTRQKEYAHNDTVTILSIGRLHYKKGWLMGLMAVKQLAQTNKNFRWIIIGDGDMKQELSLYILNMGLNDYVTLTGPKYNDDIKQAYEDADIFLLPSFTEGIANVVLEAMCMELPVLCTNCGGMPEVITDNINGMLADVYDDEALASRLTKLVNDFALREKLGKAARQRVTELFSIERQAAIFEEKYKLISFNAAQ